MDPDPRPELNFILFRIQIWIRNNISLWIWIRGIRIKHDADPHLLKHIEGPQKKIYKREPRLRI